MYALPLGSYEQELLHLALLLQLAAMQSSHLEEASHLGLCVEVVDGVKEHVDGCRRCGVECRPVPMVVLCTIK